MIFSEAFELDYLNSARSLPINLENAEYKYDDLVLIIYIYIYIQICVYIHFKKRTDHIIVRIIIIIFYIFYIQIIDLDDVTLLKKSIEKSFPEQPRNVKIRKRKVLKKCILIFE